MFDRLTNNIGESIKGLSKVLYIIHIAVAVISAVVALLGGLIAAVAEDVFVGFIVFSSCIGFAIVNVIYAYIITLVVYGFGELISTNKKTFDLLNNSKKDNIISDNNYTNSTNTIQQQDIQIEKQKSIPTHIFRCEECERMIESYPCIYCGANK